MKHIGEYCRNTAQRLSIELSAVENGYDIDLILGESDLSKGLICVAARSGVGKTTFALDLVLGQAVKNGKKVLIFSCEKSAEQIVSQLVMKLCGLNTCFVNANDAEKIHKLSQALSILNGLDIYIESFEDKTDPELSDVEEIVEKINDVGLVMIDGLYCLWDEGKSEKIAEQETKESIKHLKDICKRNNLPIIITTYFSRSEIKRMFRGETSKNVFLINGVDVFIALYRSVIGTTISNTTDFLVTDSSGRYDRDILQYDTKNRRFLRG